MRRLSVIACFLFLGFGAGLAGGETVTYVPLQCGDDEREDAGGTCLQETSFNAGTVSAAQHLKIGGDAAGCNSEWAASFEFDLSARPAMSALVAATLVVRKTGYSDDAQGFAYLGAFAYGATGTPVIVERADLTPETAQSIVYPPAANIDVEFEVTAAIQALLAGGGTRAGILLAGVYSEVGYEDWISVGGTNSMAPPRLIVTFDRSIATEPATWSAIRSAYR